MNTSELSNRLTIIINTCENYSDLWDGHVALLNRNWADRKIRSVLLTDGRNDRSFDGIEIFSAGSGLELPQRIKRFLPEVETEYVFITLDDYYLIEPVDPSRISCLIDAMDELGLDYIRLFDIPPSKKKIEGFDGLYEIDLDSEKDVNYQVNLYPGIWRKSLLEKTVSASADAWNYELSLTRTARENNADCAMTKGGEFVILDVVRKGKLLHKANAYFKKHPELYNGERKVISRFQEIKIAVMTAMKCVLSQKKINAMKSVFRRFGMKFYSDAAEGKNK